MASDARQPHVQRCLDTELGTVRGELLRADTKAATMLQLTGALLVGGLAVFATARLPAPAAAAGWAATAIVAAAVVLLTGAVRPNLGGGFGFMRYANAASGQEMLDTCSSHAGAEAHEAGLLVIRRFIGAGQVIATADLPITAAAAHLVTPS